MAVMTLSRLPGALGDEIAAGLTARLGYRLVTRPELGQLAAGLGGPRQSLDRSPELGERGPSFWERLNDDRRRNAAVLRHAALQLAVQDNVIIVGLGAGQFLAGLPQVLRAQMIAPPELRLERVQQYGYEDTRPPLTREQAQELIRQRDRDNASYMRYLFHIDWLEPHHWDLIVNSARFTVPQAVEVLAAPVDGQLLEPDAAARAHLADRLLASRVEVALLIDAGLWVNQLKVAAHAGRVRVSGTVSTYEEMDLVEASVRSVEGVVSVDTEIILRPPLTAV